MHERSTESRGPVSAQNRSWRHGRIRMPAWDHQNEKDEEPIEVARRRRMGAEVGNIDKLTRGNEWTRNSNSYGWARKWLQRHIPNSARASGLWRHVFWVRMLFRCQTTKSDWGKVKFTRWGTQKDEAARNQGPQKM